MLRALLSFSVVALVSTSACKKDRPVETVPPDLLDPTLKKKDPPKPVVKKDPPKPVSGTLDTFPDEVRPPTASDLSHYISDLKGPGALLAVIATTKGEIRCELYEEKTPMTVANFVGLARGLKPFRDSSGTVTRPFYDGLVFHRVIPTFMIQGGDPSGNGTGGPGYKFDNEIHPLLRHDGPGTLAMANSGPDTNGSQFYITEDARAQLDDSYSVFGRCKNIGVVRDIARVDRDGSDRPSTAVSIEHILIVRGEL